MNEHNFAKFYINLLFIFNKILFQMIVDHFVVFSNDGDCIAHCCPFSNQSKQQQQRQHTVWLKLVVLFFCPSQFISRWILRYPLFFTDVFTLSLLSSVIAQKIARVSLKIIYIFFTFHVKEKIHKECLSLAFLGTSFFCIWYFWTFWFFTILAPYPVCCLKLCCCLVNMR